LDLDVKSILLMVL